MDGTGQWLLEHPEFEDWAVSSSSGVLLLHEIPGSGKSTLCSTVIDSLVTALAATSDLTAPFAYVYRADSEFEPQRSSPDEILRCILRQLAVSSPPNHEIRSSLLSTYESWTARAKIDGLDLPKLRAKESVECILDLANEDPLTIIIDAVDEVAEADRHRLLGSLNRIVANAENVVKIFVTSRNDAQVFALLSSARKINVTPEDAAKDVQAFIRRQLSEIITQKRLLNGAVRDELFGLMEKALVDGASEM